MPSNESSQVQNRVASLIEKARAAQLIYNEYNQNQVDEVVTAIGWAIINPDNNHLLTSMAIKDTGIGKYEDKIIKNYRKTLGLLRDLKGAKSVGIIAEYPEKGLIENCTTSRCSRCSRTIYQSCCYASQQNNQRAERTQCHHSCALAKRPEGLRKVSRAYSC